MNALSTAWRLAAKDLRLYFRDRNGMLLGLFLPLALVLVFGFISKVAFGGDGGMGRTTLWVLDLDQSAASRDFVGALRGVDLLRVRPDPEEPAPDEATLRRKVEDGDAHHGLVVLPGFGQALEDGRLPTLRMIRDPDRELEAQMVALGLLQATLASLGSEAAPRLTARVLQLAGLPEIWADRMLQVSEGFSRTVTSLFTEAEEQGLLEAEVETGEPAAGAGSGFSFQQVMTEIVPLEKVDVRPEGRSQQLSFMLAHSVSGISIMMLMFGLVACGSTLLLEREEGTLPRLLCAPSPRGAILLGKFLFTAIIGAIQLVLLFGVSSVVFGIDLGARPYSLILVSLVVLTAVTSFGLLIAAWARTPKQAEGISTLLILVMSALGGAWVPVQMWDLPLPAEIATRLTLTHWAMASYQGIFWYDKSCLDPGILRNLAVLLGFALVAGACAVACFRRRYVEAG